jgi:hypothetical protein
MTLCERPRARDAQVLAATTISEQSNSHVSTNEFENTAE